MGQPARRRKTQPRIPSLTSVMTPSGPDEPEGPEGSDATSEAAPAEEMVTCFLSGELLPKSRAVQVRLGRGRVMWMARDLTNQG